MRIVLIRKEEDYLYSTVCREMTDEIILVQETAGLMRPNQP